MTSNAPEAGRYVVLAALAFDETGDAALTEAARMAAAHGGGELHVVHVVREADSAPSTSELVSLDKRLEGAPAEIQRRVEASWSAATPTKVTAHVRAGTPERSILQAAVDIDADLIVVGTHKRRGMEKLLLGSVAEAVLRHAHCPVLVAVMKDYSEKSRSPSIAPPCPQCLAVRKQTHAKTYWCEQHSRTYGAPHVYEPTGSTRTSVMPSQ